jgi:hypothetical protein
MCCVLLVVMCDVQNSAMLGIPSKTATATVRGLDSTWSCSLASSYRCQIQVSDRWGVRGTGVRFSLAQSARKHGTMLQDAATYFLAAVAALDAAIAPWVAPAFEVDSIEYPLNCVNPNVVTRDVSLFALFFPRSVVILDRAII